MNAVPCFVLTSIFNDTDRTRNADTWRYFDTRAAAITFITARAADFRHNGFRPAYWSTKVRPELAKFADNGAVYEWATLQIMPVYQLINPALF